MIRRLICVLLMICCASTISTVRAQSSSCSNADFELNSFSGWSGTTGSCCPINSTTPGIVNGRHTIMTGGTDPNTNNVLNCVAPGGNFSVRLGNDNTNSEAEQLSYSFVVSPQTQLFVYRYAVVLQDPGHPIADQPRFEIKVFDQNGNVDTMCGVYNVYAAAGIPGFTTINHAINGTTHWKDWTTVGIDLSSKMGSTITIEFSTGDCAQGAHFGYAYIDCMCYPFNVLADFCPGSFTATLTAPPGFSSYQWSTGETTQIINIVNPTLGDTFNVIMTSVTGCQVSLNSIIRESIVASAYHLADSCFNNTLFLDSSYVITGSPINTWEWDFDDGTTSNIPNPVHAYTSPGTYDVTLIITNQGGCKDTVNQSVTVMDIPTPAFSFTPVCPGTPMQFDDSSTVSPPAAISGWTWDFGDGTIEDTTRHPLHIYNLPGTYQVTLIAEDSYGCRDTIVAPANTVAAPVSGFSYTTACATSDVQFTDTTTISGGAISLWIWDFGDASPVSNQQHPLHTYPGPGIYTVLLTSVVNGVCSDTASQTISLQNPPNTTFTTVNNCAKSGLLFTDQSTLPGSIMVAWNWNFGDGSAASFLQNPVHIYNTPGTYAVTLTVTASNGCQGTGVDSVTILPSPEAGFITDNLCPGQSGSFTDTTQFIVNAGSSWSWNFDDGTAVSNQQDPQHIYNIGGVYNVMLSVIDGNGCKDTIYKNVITAIAPVTLFTIPSGCAGVTIPFQSNSAIATGTIDSTIWNFGDGSANVNGLSTGHIFNTGGLYPVTLTTISMVGCRSSLMKEVNIYALPVANFASNPVCLGDTSHFTDISLPGDDTLNSWHWSFGDGITSSLQNGTHVFNTDSLQTVMLIVTDANGCRDTGIRTIMVLPLPRPDFHTNGMLCENQSIQFIHNITAPAGIQSMLWDFDDNSTSGGANPSHTFAAGNYNVILHVTDNSGCTDSLLKFIHINSNPLASLVTHNQCIYTPVNFQSISSVSGGSIGSLTWDFGDQQGDTLNNISHIYNNPGNYNVTLSVISNAGCSDDSTLLVSVHPKPVAIISCPPVCALHPAVLSSLSNVQTGSLIAWNWNYGDSSPSDNSENTTHSFSVDSTYHITLLVTSDSLCTDTATRNITIYPLSVSEFTTDTVCFGMPTHFINQSTVDGSNITGSIWNFNMAAQDTSYNPLYISPSAGIFNTTLISITTEGCTDSVTHTVKVYELPVPDFIADVTSGCEPLDVKFTNHSFSNDGIINRWNWLFGDTGTDTLEHPYHQYLADGIYDITLTVTTDLQCIDSINKPAYITVHPLPVAGFSYSPEHPDLIHPNVNFHDESTGAAQWFYDFGDLSTNNESDPSHTYLSIGIYNVMQQVTSAFGCLDTAFRIIEVNGVYTLYIPNAFTPNNDGKNDEFFAYGEGITDFNIAIFDRWGQAVFESSEINKGWHGDVNGKTGVQDVYFYVVKITDLFKKEHTVNGRVTAIY
ncbi:MAG: PKD domain-containing protein [Bacteroidota bacterium]